MQCQRQQEAWQNFTLHLSALLLSSLSLALSFSFSFALPLRWTRFYFLLCCEFINKTCICDTRARNTPTRRGEGSEGGKRAWQGKYQPANKNRKPCIAVASLRVLASLLLPLAGSSFCYCFCHTSRFAKSCAWHFGLVFHSALTFTLPSLILSCLPTLPLATCPMRHATCHLHATQPLGGQRSAAQRAHQFPQAPPG